MTDSALSVSLDGVEPIDGVSFIKAEWWDDASRFAVILARGPGNREKRLRMDLNKQSFLDHFGDDRLDRSLAAGALAVWEAIVKARDHAPRQQAKSRYAV